MLGKSVTFSKLGEMASCRRHPVGPSSTQPSGHQHYMFSGATYVGCGSPSVVSGLTAVGILVERLSPTQAGCKDIPHVMSASPLVALGAVETQS